MSVNGEELMRAFYKLFYLRFWWFKGSELKRCVSKVLLEIWDIFLHENNRNYNCYRFSYKFVFLIFLSFLRNPKTSIKISASWWSCNAKHFCSLFIASHALLQSYAEDFYKGIFLHVIPVHFIVQYRDSQRP